MFTDLQKKFGVPCQIVSFGHANPKNDPGFKIVDQATFITDYLSNEAREDLFGHPKPWTQAEIKAKVEKWIGQIGIKTRPFFSGTTAELGIIAAKKCLANANNFDPTKIDIIIGASNTGPGYSSLADHVKEALGISEACCFDITEACTAGSMAIMDAVSHIKSGVAEYVLVVCAEKATILPEMDKYLYSNLFSDGSYAILISAKKISFLQLLIPSLFRKKDSFLAFDAISLPEDGQLNLIRKTKTGFWQNGPLVHKFVGTVVSDFLIDFLKKANIDPIKVHHVVPHQPSGKTLTLLERKFRKAYPLFTGIFHNEVENTGNMSSATTGNLISNAIQEGRIKKGELVIVLTFGAGLSIVAYAFIA